MVLPRTPFMFPRGLFVPRQDSTGICTEIEHHRVTQSSAPIPPPEDQLASKSGNSPSHGPARKGGRHRTTICINSKAATIPRPHRATHAEKRKKRAEPSCTNRSGWCASQPSRPHTWPPLRGPRPRSRKRVAARHPPSFRSPPSDVVRVIAALPTEGRLIGDGLSLMRNKMC